MADEVVVTAPLPRRGYFDIYGLSGEEFFDWTQSGADNQVAGLPQVAPVIPDDILITAPKVAAPDVPINDPYFQRPISTPFMDIPYDGPPQGSNPPPYQVPDVLPEVVVASSRLPALGAALLVGYGIGTAIYNWFAPDIQDLLAPEPGAPPERFFSVDPTEVTLTAPRPLPPPQITPRIASPGLPAVNAPPQIDTEPFPDPWAAPNQATRPPYPGAPPSRIIRPPRAGFEFDFPPSIPRPAFTRPPQLPADLLNLVSDPLLNPALLTAPLPDAVTSGEGCRCPKKKDKDKKAHACETGYYSAGKDGKIIYEKWGVTKECRPSKSKVSSLPSSTSRTFSRVVRSNTRAAASSSLSALWRRSLAGS